MKQLELFENCLEKYEEESGNPFLKSSKVRYLHCSMLGSYYIPCEVLDVNNNFSPPLTYFDKIVKDGGSHPVGLYFQIRFFDPNIEETIVRWVEEDYLKFL